MCTHDTHRMTTRYRAGAPSWHNRHGLVLLGFVAVAGPLLAITPAQLVFGADVSPLVWLLLLAVLLTYGLLPRERSWRYAPAFATRAGRNRRAMPRGSHDA